MIKNIVPSIMSNIVPSVIPKIRVFSDLHLEFDYSIINKCKDICIKNPTKYTVLAGDITVYNKKHLLNDLVKELQKYTSNIIYVLGNHEYYGSDGTSTKNILQEYKDLCEELDIFLLENESLETEDFIFYGCTLWGDFKKDAYERVNDKFFMSLRDIQLTHYNSRNLLNKYIETYTDKNHKKPLVVVSHYLPSYKLIDEKYQKFGSLNSAFASDLDYMINFPIKYWIYGHTHTPNFSDINGVKLICNPHGYPSERKKLQDYEDITID